MRQRSVPCKVDICLLPLFPRSDEENSPANDIIFSWSKTHANVPKAETPKVVH